MFYILLTVCFSVVVSVMLKLARRYHIDIYQAITWNYSIAAALAWLIFRPHLHAAGVAPFFTYSALAILLPALFLILAASIRDSGIVLTDIAERLSLFIPIIAAFVIFGESLNTLKVTGIAVGFVAIICTIPWGKKDSQKRKGARGWLYLLLVFV